MLLSAIQASARMTPEDPTERRNTASIGLAAMLAIIKVMERIEGIAGAREFAEEMVVDCEGEGHRGLR